MKGWYQGRSLRSRLAIMASVAVALAIAMCSVAAWFIVQEKLYELQRVQLSNVPLPLTPFSHTLPTCATTAQGALTQVKAATTAYEADHPNGAILGTGRGGDAEYLPAGTTSVCLSLGANLAIVPAPSDYDVLDLPPNEGDFRQGHFTDGTPAMIRVTHYVDRTTHQDMVMLLASPLTEVDHSLQQLAFLLAGVSAIGVAVAGITGRIVARAALKPVHDLTDLVEHIARTEEVGTTIPVHGNDEIARLSDSFNSMSTALANSRERQTRLIADAGHELRTPLTSLRTNVDLMIRSDDTGRPLPPATRTKLLASMKAQMQELTLLIGDLLQLSRPDSPRPGQNVATVAFHDIAQRAVERGKLRGPGLTFNVSLEPWYVRADAAALERAVMNLLDNAVKYSPPAGAIDVALQQGRLTVRDHGPGIPADELQYVFDRFWRSPSSRQLPGSGLGLSIVAQTVQDSGGQVALGPAQDGGPGALAIIRMPGSAEPPPSTHPARGTAPGPGEPTTGPTPEPAPGPEDS
ncbi:HAMP domain-containing sensor histidine kinase [Kitasatospora kifunensis]|uniref:histidine kinase n=2 Tax=Kitasatospora kifunensis TaxID=58351 RepID=A0A7W7R2G3_KITKI|nr:HAMP domain-containing sensor histidine kinase [Kitasatospora kifunensis]MBB4924186.1 two-component system sensor histidine kinase MprB [Kitasatospora kifunensis]